MGPEWRLYMLVGLSVLAGVLLGAALLRKNMPRAYGAVFLGHVLAAVALFLAVQEGRDMQGLGPAIMLAVFVLPATLGMALGGGVIWWRRR